MDPATQSQLNSIRLTLQALELQVSSGKVQTGALDDLKSAVDEIRLRIWAIMAAAAQGNDGMALQRFRLRRTIESCDSLTIDFEARKILRRHPECAMLIASMGRLTKTMGPESGAPAGT